MLLHRRDVFGAHFRVQVRADLDPAVAGDAVLGGVDRAILGGGQPAFGGGDAVAQLSGAVADRGGGGAGEELPQQVRHLCEPGFFG
ncbi:Uncharacterised protein [Mycobacteroides abscessus subsp. abscessus]|nr:Uncharacterised protein [Mycobacteroides abscessus subsp. abscessus]